MLHFKNKEPLNLNFITTFGVSDKDTDSPIGYFGTGLKYAIAVLTREKIPVTLKVNNEVYKFSTSSKKYRNKEFQVVTMNDIELPFTTELGKNWKLRDAYRELYSNCKDENGIIDEKDDLNKWGTVFSVEGKSLKEIHENRYKTILFDEKGCKSTDYIQVKENGSGKIFYKGILVGETDRTIGCDINILTNNFELTEDRTFKYFYQVAELFTKYIVESASENLVELYLGYLQHDVGVLDFDKVDSSNISGTFVTTVKDMLRKKSRPLPTRLIDYLYWSNNLLSEEDFKVSGIPLDNLSLREASTLEEAKNFLLEFGIPINKYPIVITDELDRNVFAFAGDDNVIYLSRKLLQNGITEIIHGLYEEFIHLETGYHDETRELQTYLFKQIIELMRIVNEERKK